MKEKNKEPLFHIVKRDALPWYKALGIRFLAILLAYKHQMCQTPRSAKARKTIKF